MTTRAKTMRAAAKSVQPIGPEQTRAATAGADAELAQLERWLEKRAAMHQAAYDRVKAEDARKPVDKARFGLQELHAKRWAEASDILAVVRARAHWPKESDDG